MRGSMTNDQDRELILDGREAEVRFLRLNPQVPVWRSCYSADEFRAAVRALVATGRPCTQRINNCFGQPEVEVSCCYDDQHTYCIRCDLAKLIDAEPAVPDLIAQARRDLAESIETDETAPQMAQVGATS